MKNILITGAGGFIGSHLAELCVRKGYNVKAFVHYNSANSWGWLDQSPQKKDMEIVAGDIRDYDSVTSALKACDTVFHLAALIGIPYSYVSPLAYVRTNVEGTYNVIQASRHFQIGNTVITSTSETYGTAQYVPIDEEHPIVGQSPYSATKIGADQLALSYYRSFDLPIKIVRPFNTYGPRQSSRAIIPTIITQILSGQRRIKLGNLLPTRDLTYVKDTANGFLEIAISGKLFGEITNIGMNEEIAIADLIKLIAETMNRKVEVVKEDARVRPDNSEVDRLCCDNSKLKKLTDWVPQYDLKTGIAETIAWMRENTQYYKPEQYNI